MIVSTIEKLPQFDKDEPLIVDIETTSFDDDVMGLNPFRGHRICGVGICNVAGDHSWYVPFRNSFNPTDNIPLDKGKLWLKDLIGSGRDLINHNIKFDARCWHFDGAKHKGKLIDTMVMARLWKSNLYNLSLNHLTGGGKGKAVKAFLKKIKSKDYGRLPVEIIGPYCELDCTDTAGLYRKFKHEMRSEVMPVWKTEIALTPHLLRSEIHGIHIDAHHLKITYANLIRRMLELQDQIDKMAGVEVDCLSDIDLHEVLTGRMGFEVQSWTDKGNPQWNKSALTQLNHPIGQAIQEYTHLSWFTSTYCKGWLNRIDDNNRIHPNFSQPGAKTGRMSSKDPCVTNMPAEAEIFVLPDPGCVILGNDYSQIEYRIFAHYANDKKIIDEYKENPKADYHQMLADLLGVPRQFAKSLNFSFLYGMGKETLLHTIAGIIAMSQDDETMVRKLRAFGLVGGQIFARQTKKLKLDFSEFKSIATGIYNEYHRRVPSIKALSLRVKRACKSRGWLRNYMGRVYTVPWNDVYKSVNLLIQGSAADIFKDRILAVLEQIPNVMMITNVYDSIYFSCPIEIAEEENAKILEVLEDFQFRVPLSVQPSVGARNLGSCVKIENSFKDALKLSYKYQREFKRKTIHITDFHVAGRKALDK